jgi:hypothetical protein
MFYPIEMFTRKIFVYEHRISPRSLGFRNSDDIHKIGFPLCSVCQSVWDSRMGPGIKTTVKICHLDSRYMFRTLTLFLVSVYIYCNWDNLGWIDLFSSAIVIGIDQPNQLQVVVFVTWWFIPRIVSGL